MTRFYCLLLCFLSAGCLPSVSSLEAAKQLGSYIFRQAGEELNDTSYLSSYSDYQVCIAATKIDSYEYSEADVAKFLLKKQNLENFPLTAGKTLKGTINRKRVTLHVLKVELNSTFWYEVG
jgi:hypothetical protein